MSYLVRYPIDTLKIDRVFVNDMVKNADSEKVVLTLVRLAGSLNMSVIAEGVETKEQLEMLSRFGCDEAQGYYFARPMPLNELKDFLACDSGSARGRTPIPTPLRLLNPCSA